jgi:aryl-phospho-beta-D-glucosidase BglC (GH1 family)
MMLRACLMIMLCILAPALARGEPAPAVAALQRLGRGVNVLGYDPIWSEPAKGRFRMQLFERIRTGGFQHVRINLHAFAHLDKENRLDPGWLITLDAVIEAATRAGLLVILDEHDFQFCGKTPDTCRVKLLAVWEQLSIRYKDAPDSVLFEILNEPSEKLTPELWNALLVEGLAVIRRTNPARPVIIGPGQYSNIRALGTLVLPADDANIIATVHYYDPFRFTHQGTTWTNPSRENDIGIPWGTAEERERVERDIAGIAAWSRDHGRPVLLGEFGAFDKADMASRVAWTSTVARAAETNGLPWSYWQFEGTFGVFDIQADAWVEPIHRALVPQ